MTTLLDGIDVSAYQPGSITKNVHGDFALIKATEGTSYTSSTMKAQIAGAKKTGKLLGLYHFASRGSARAQAAFFYKKVKRYVGTALLVLDFEGAALSQGPAWAKDFLDELYRLSGVRALIYLQYYEAIKPGYDALVRAGYGLWRAGQNSWGGGYRHFAPLDKGRWPFVVMDQYTSHGQLPGYSGRLDLDVFYSDRDTWMKYATPGGKKPKTAPAGKPQKVKPHKAKYPVDGFNASSWPTKTIQKIVGAKQDNIYGSETSQKVAAWEDKHGLTPDGSFGPKCVAKATALGKAPKKKTTSKKPNVAPKRAPKFPLPKGWYFGPKSGPIRSVSGYYSHGADLKRWQQQMHDRGWVITVDGRYGPQTAGVADGIQKQEGLKRDKLIGDKTWAIAWTAPVK